MPLVDEERSARTVNFDWPRASPRTRWFAVKSAYEFNFRHIAAPPLRYRQARNAGLQAHLSDAQSPENIKHSVNE
jgi:hypothetical protein